VAAACLLAATPGFSFGQAASAPLVLKRGNGAEPATLDPHKSTGVTESNIQRDIFEGLVGESAKGELIPGAAERWTISTDGLEYRFQLRKDGRWQNGDPVAAEDFAYSLRRAVDPATASDYAFILAPILNAEAITAGKAPPDQLGVSAEGPLELKIRLKAPTPYFLGLLAHSTAYPVHRASLEKHGDRFTRPGNLIGNGPYQLVEWTPQSRVVLRKAKTYREADSIRIDEVHFYPIEDGNTELRRYRAGELDMTNSVPIDQLDWVFKNLPREYRVSPYLGTYYYAFNLAKPPFQGNKALRRALALALDRDILTSKVTKAGQIPAFGWVPPGVAGYQSQSLAEARISQADRITLAKKLYAEAGYSDQKPLEVEILYNTSEAHKQIAVAVAGMWKSALGVRTRLTNQEWKVYLSTRQQGNFQIARAGWIGDYNDANTFAEIFVTGAGLNEGGYSNPGYDRLVRQAALTAEPRARANLLQQAERTLLDDLPILPIYFYVSQALVKPHVTGWEPNILDHHPTRYLGLNRAR
jgi:oligopeptide transport system substrate-binding protein